MMTTRIVERCVMEKTKMKVLKVESRKHLGFLIDPAGWIY